MTKENSFLKIKIMCDTPSPPACLSHLEDIKIKILKEKKINHALLEVLE